MHAYLEFYKFFQSMSDKMLLEHFLSLLVERKELLQENNMFQQVTK